MLGMVFFLGMLIGVILGVVFDRRDRAARAKEE